MAMLKVSVSHGFPDVVVGHFKELFFLSCVFYVAFQQQDY